jgi:hypothetical protein
VEPGLRVAGRGGPWAWARAGSQQSAASGRAAGGRAQGVQAGWRADRRVAGATEFSDAPRVWTLHLFLYTTLFSSVGGMDGAGRTANTESCKDANGDRQS